MTDAPTQNQVRAWEPWTISEAGDEMKARNIDFLALIDRTVTQIRDAGMHWDGDAYWCAYDRVVGDRDNGNKVKQEVDTLADAMINGGNTLTNYRRILFDKVDFATEGGFTVSDSWAVEAPGDSTEDRETDRTDHQAAVTTALNEMLGAQTDINTAISDAADEVRTRGNSLGEGDAVGPESAVGNNVNNVVGQAVSDTDILAPGPIEPPNQEEIDAKYDYYEDLIERNGGTVDAGSDKKNLVAIRHETSTLANNGDGVYDDKAVLIWVDDDGTKHVSEYRANTEPTTKYIDDGDATVDVNGDGKKELGRLPAGTYEYGHNWYKNKYFSVDDGNVFRMPDDPVVTAEYDTNHDGLFNDNAFGGGGQSMFWHCGREDDVASAGCQTMPPDDWDRFVADMGVSATDKAIGPQVQLQYTLVNEDPLNGNTEYRDVDDGMV